MVDFKAIIKDLPYNRLMAIKEAIKMQWGTVEWPDHAPTVHVEEDPEDLEADLRGRHFEGLYLSYNYEGQVLDLRRPEGVDGDSRQLELHLRAREHPDEDGLEVLAHLELSRYEHKGGHINEEYFEWLDEDDIRSVLDGGTVNTEGAAVDMEW